MNNPNKARNELPAADVMGGQIVQTLPSSLTMQKDSPTSQSQITQELEPQSEHVGLHHMPHNEPNQFWYHIQREREFFCGWGAAFINISVTFPINKVIFRQQLHNISGRSAYRQLSKDGIRYLYRGLLPPLLQKTTSTSIMFGTYFRVQDNLKKSCPQLSNTANHALAAMMAGTLEALFTPFERIQTLMQASAFHNKFSNTFDAFSRLSSYGVREYYRGFSIIVLRNGPSNVFFFLGREYLQSCGPQNLEGGKKMTKDFICGACLGAMISTFFFPFNVIKTHMQCKLGGEFDGVRQTLRLVLSDRGGKVQQLFKGMHLNYTRSFISWGIINASYELLMKMFSKDSKHAGPS